MCCRPGHVCRACRTHAREDRRHSPTATTLTDTFTRTCSSGHWLLNYDYTQYEDNAWRLNLGSSQVSSPFEFTAKLSVVEAEQATDVLEQRSICSCT